MFRFIKKIKMKNLLITLFLISVALASYGQDENLKYSPGSFTGEVNLTPFGNNPVSISSIRGRYFVSESVAYRAGFFLNYRMENPSEDLSRNFLEFRISPGIEKHLDGTDRLSPYYGAGVNLGFKTATSTTELPGSDTKFIGAWNTGGKERGYVNIGFHGIAGADFFIAQHVYLGTEIGFGVTWENPSNIKRESGDSTTTLSEAGSNFELAPQFNSAIRLGFVF